MPNARVGEIDIFYDAIGDPRNDPVLLIMGLGMQLTSWDDAFCARLAQRERFVVRFDNRDIGLSSTIEWGVPPNPLGVLMGDHSSVAYTLDDMASDAVGVLDALQLEKASVVGASMGGMIAQLVAINYPMRVKSLISIMATTGATDVGQPTPTALEALLDNLIYRAEEIDIDDLVALQSAIGSGSTFARSKRQIKAAIERDLARMADRTNGASRQLLAVIAAADRTKDLQNLEVPVTVIHGTDDVLIHPSGGEATANAIPGARLKMIEGMGHDLPFEKWDEIIDAIVATA